jgi:hypothetical protein
MEMLLMGACLSLLGLAVTCLAFGTATRGEAASPEVAPEPKVAAEAAPTRFFADPVPALPRRLEQVPIEALLLQIESHVRLEHAAAESFLEAPTAALLHCRTMSPLIQ